MADRLPYFPLYAADYLADTRHLSTQEHGAYLLLLLNYWMRGGLPTDDAQLARIAGLATREWNKARPVLAAFFEDGWIHLRVDAELAKAKDKSTKRSEAGKQGNDAKRLKTKKPYVANAIANTIAKPPQTHVENDRKPTASSSDLRFKKEDIPESSHPTTQPDAYDAMKDPRFDDLRGMCLDAVGHRQENVGLGIASIGPIYAMLQAGWSWDIHILPKLQEFKAKGYKGSNWDYYAKSIRNGLDKPAAVPGPSSASGDAYKMPESDWDKIRKMPADYLARKWVQGNRDWWWPDVPTPDKPGSYVTKDHLDEAKRIEAQRHEERMARQAAQDAAQ